MKRLPKLSELPKLQGAVHQYIAAGFSGPRLKTILLPIAAALFATQASAQDLAKPYPAIEKAQCQAALEAVAEFEFVATPDAKDAACTIARPVRITRILTDGAGVEIKGKPVLACEFVIAFADWTQTIAAPMAKGHLDRNLTAIQTGPGFSCRRRNNAPTGKLSEHAFGMAIDIVGFEFAKGDADEPPRFAVAPGDELEKREAAYQRAVRKAACGTFTTILGPGSNAAHRTHLHFDLGRIYKDGERRERPYLLCE